MATKPNVTPLDIEVTFDEEGVDARALITKTDKKGIITFASRADVKKFNEYYKSLRKTELLEKKRNHSLKKWEEEFLEKL